VALFSTGFVLVSWWKALLFLPVVVAWAWLISTVYDKHAARFHLARERWNTIHLTVGVVALLAGLLVPAFAGISGIAGFIVGWLVMVVLLAGDVVSYPMVANKDPRVPEAHRVRINLDSLRAAREQKAQKKLAGTAELVVLGGGKKAIVVPQKETPEFEIRVASERPVLKALEARAAQLDIMPGEGGYATRYLVDGVAQGGEAMGASEAGPVIDFWRSAAGMDLSDRRRQ